MRYTITLLGATLAAPALAEPPAVITDFQVTHSLVSQVMGDLGTPDLLLDRGGDPHGFQLRPTQARSLEQSDLVVWVGPEFAPWMQRAIDGVGVSGDVLTLFEVDGLHRMEFAFGHAHAHDDHGHDHDDHGHAHDDHGHDHDDHGHAHDDHGHDHDEHGHAHDDHGHDHDDHGHSHDDHGHDHDDHGHSHDDHGHDHDGHGHSHDDHGHDHDDHAHSQDHGHSHDGLDPHAWMNFGNVRIWLDEIAATLSALDPDNADTYADNAAAAREAVAGLRAEIAGILEPVGDAPLVMFHDAYGYLADEFGLNIAGTIALGDAAAPGAARLTEMRAQLADAGAVCIFPEVNHSSRYVDVVVEGTGVRVGEQLDPAGVMFDPGPELFATKMRTMATLIADCVTDES